MKRVIEFNHGSANILVEMEEEAPRGDRLSGRDGTIGKAKQSFEEAVAAIGPIAETIMRQLSELGPESVNVEFGIKFTSQAGVILASSAVEGHCKVALTWTPKKGG